MAQAWAPKAPTEVVQRRWTVPVDSDDGLQSITPAISGGAITASSIEGNDAVLTISGGAADVTAIITLTATTSRGRTLVETIYLPILTKPNDFAYTGQDIASFALRKVVGVGNTPDAAETDDALERLSDMLARWKGQGAELGVVLPVLTSTVLYVSDEFASAIKANLILELTGLYEFEPGPRDVDNARRGLQQIKSKLLSKDTRASVYY